VVAEDVDGFRVTQIDSSDVASEEPPSVADRDGVVGDSQRRSRSGFLLSRVGPWAVPIFLVLLFIGFSIATPTFGTVDNARIIITNQAVVVLLGMAIIVPLRAGDFDLSVSSVMIVSGATIGVLHSNGHSGLTAIAVAVLIGPVVGLFNGILVVKIGIDSFIATLGTLTIITGFVSLMTKGALITTFPEGLTNFAEHRILDFPMPVWVGWAIALALWYVFEKTPAGRYLLFIGGNRGSAQLAGLRVDGYRQGAFLLSGTLSAIAGVMFAGGLGSVDPSSGTSYLLPPITAAFLGASAITIGRFNVVGTLFAIYMLAVGITGLQLLGLDRWIANVFNGVCLLLAMAFAILLKNASAKWSAQR